MQQNNLPRALAPVMAFIDDASNWYVRRSRSRFWKTEEGGDKANAYMTLHYVLTRLSLVLAPFTPFLAEELYRNLTAGESVHLLDWPEPGQVNESVVAKMQLLRQVITSALAERAMAGIKVRQPLQSLTFTMPHPFDGDYLEILKDELNVKEVVLAAPAITDAKTLPQFELNTNLTPELKREGLMRETVRQVQNARKQAGLNVDDRINLSLQAVGELNQTVTEYGTTIKAETLATSLSDEPLIDGFTSTVTIEGSELLITLSVAK